MHETADGEMVCDGCVEEEEYVYVVGRDGLHPRWDCTWSDYHENYVYDQDVAGCDNRDVNALHRAGAYHHL